MIIIEKTAGKTAKEVRDLVFSDICAAAKRGLDVWVHVEKERREVAVNTDDDPIRPGMLSFGEYAEGAIPVAEWEDKPLVVWASVCEELSL